MKNSEFEIRTKEKKTDTITTKPIRQRLLMG